MFREATDVSAVFAGLSGWLSICRLYNIIIVQSVSVIIVQSVSGHTMCRWAHW